MITWVINIILTFALLRGITPYEVWFGRKPPSDFQVYKERVPRRARTAVGEEVEEGVGEVIEVEVEEEENFVDEDLAQEQAEEGMILSELTKRVAEHVKKQNEKIVKKVKAKELVFEVQEIATLQIPKQYRFSTEPARIPVRVLEHAAKVSNLRIYS